MKNKDKKDIEAIEELHKMEHGSEEWKKQLQLVEIGLSREKLHLPKHPFGR